MSQDYSKLNQFELMQLARDLRAEKRQAEDVAKKKGRELDTVLAFIQENLIAQGVDKTSKDGITVSISEQELPQVEDWQKVYDFIEQNGYWHLLQKRISSTAFRELKAVTGEDVPGVSSFTKVAVNLRVA